MRYLIALPGTGAEVGAAEEVVGLAVEVVGLAEVVKVVEAVPGIHWPV